MTHSAGQLGMLAQLNNLDDPWTAYTPTLSGFPATITRARYKAIGKTVHVQVKLTLTGAATGAMTVSLPVSGIAAYAPSLTSPEPVGVVAVAQVSNAWFQGVTSMASTSTVMFFTLQGGGQFNATVPFTWASGHVFAFSITYESA